MNTFTKLDNRQDLLDSITQFAKEEIPEAGKISYPLSDGKTFLNITLEEGSYESMNPGKEFYSVKVIQTTDSGVVDKFCEYTDSDDIQQLRNTCRDCLEYYEGMESRQRLSLDNLSSYANSRTAGSHGQNKERDHEID